MLIFDTVVILVHFAKGAVDRLGRPTLTELGRTPGVPARITQVKTDEAPTFVTDRYRALLPPTVNVRPQDQILHDGRTFRVEGTAELKHVPGLTGISHLAVNLIRISES